MGVGKFPAGTQIEIHHKDVRSGTKSDLIFVPLLI